MKDHGGHLVNEPRLLLFEVFKKQQLEIK